jgi:hypothetical protein
MREQKVDGMPCHHGAVQKQRKNSLPLEEVSLERFWSVTLMICTSRKHYKDLQSNISWNGEAELVIVCLMSFNFLLLKKKWKF